MVVFQVYCRVTQSYTYLFFFKFLFLCRLLQNIDQNSLCLLVLIGFLFSKYSMYMSVPFNFNLFSNFNWLICKMRVIKTNIAVLGAKLT